MEDRARIIDKLRKKEQEIQSLEERLRSARIYAQALQDVLKMLVNEEPANDPVLKAGSAAAQARDIILNRGAPTHVLHLLQAMGKETSRDNRASLVSSLSAYVRRGEIFSRTAPNTFGLLELGHTEAGAEEVEPPPGFGATSSPEKRAVATLATESAPSEIDDDSPF